MEKKKLQPVSRLRLPNNFLITKPNTKRSPKLILDSLICLCGGFFVLWNLGQFSSQKKMYSCDRLIISGLVEETELHTENPQKHWENLCPGRTKAGKPGHSCCKALLILTALLHSPNTRVHKQNTGHIYQITSIQRGSYKFQENRMHHVRGRLGNFFH